MSSMTVLSASSMKLAVMFLLVSECLSFSFLGFCDSHVTPAASESRFRVRQWDGKQHGKPRHHSLHMSDNKKKSSSLDENVRNRLLSESIAPWRTVRLFLYFSGGSGALLGGLITLSGTIAAMSGAQSDVDLNTEVSPWFGEILTCHTLKSFWC